MTPAEMREMAAKVADDEDGNFTWSGEDRNVRVGQRVASEIAAAIRALPIPDTTAADEALETAREALERLSTAEVFTGEGNGWTHPEFAARIYFAREALAVIDAAKAKGGG